MRTYHDHRNFREQIYLFRGWTKSMKFNPCQTKQRATTWVSPVLIRVCLTVHEGVVKVSKAYSYLRQTESASNDPIEQKIEGKKRPTYARSAHPPADKHDTTAKETRHTRKYTDKTYATVCLLTRQTHADMTYTRRHDIHKQNEKNLVRQCLKMARKPPAPALQTQHAHTCSQTGNTHTCSQTGNTPWHAREIQTKHTHVHTWKDDIIIIHGQFRIKPHPTIVNKSVVITRRCGFWMKTQECRSNFASQQEITQIQECWHNFVSQ